MLFSRLSFHRVFPYFWPRTIWMVQSLVFYNVLQWFQNVIWKVPDAHKLPNFLKIKSDVVQINTRSVLRSNQDKQYTYQNCLQHAKSQLEFSKIITTTICEVQVYPFLRLVIIVKSINMQRIFAITCWVDAEQWWNSTLAKHIKLTICEKNQNTYDDALNKASGYWIIKSYVYIWWEYMFVFLSSWISV